MPIKCSFYPREVVSEKGVEIWKKVGGQEYSVAVEENPQKGVNIIIDVKNGDDYEPQYKLSFTKDGVNIQDRRRVLEGAIEEINLPLNLPPKN